MVVRKLKDQMMGFLESKLQDPSVSVAVKRDKTVIPGTASDYFVITNLADPTGQKGLVLAINDIYKNDALPRFERAARAQQIAPITFILLKDGKTFFRSAAQDNHYKGKQDLSLKEYTPAQINQMILFRPEEKWIFNDSTMNGVQYYQPQSAQLQEAVVTFDFDLVEYDYSHVRGDFVPENKPSEKLFLWTRRYEDTTSLRQRADGLLIKR